MPMAASDNAFTIRRAAAADAPALGRLGALLLRTHYDFDRQRFLAPGDAPEEGYAWFLRGQLRSKGVVVFVAELKETGAVAGYVYRPLSRERRGCPPQADLKLAGISGHWQHRSRRPAPHRAPARMGRARRPRGAREPPLRGGSRQIASSPPS
jgi:hypothetical protein